MENIKIYDVRIHPGDSAFLIDDGETSILCDSGFGFTGYDIANKIKGILKDRNLDYMLLTHSHYDHALGSAYIMEKYPNATVIAGKYSAEIFKRPGAIRLMKELDCKIAAKYGVTDYPFLGDKLKVDIPVEEGDTLTLGKMQLKVLNLTGHTKCSVGFYCEERQFLIGCETLGVYNGHSSIIPSVLVGYNDSLASIGKVKSLSIKHILAPHLGLLNEDQTKFYLENMEPELRKAAEFIVSRIKAGSLKEDIHKEYKDAYSDPFTSEAYPEDAANLNISIMIDLIKKEFSL